MFYFFKEASDNIVAKTLIISIINEIALFIRGHTKISLKETLLSIKVLGIFVKKTWQLRMVDSTFLKKLMIVVCCMIQD